MGWATRQRPLPTVASVVMSLSGSAHTGGDDRRGAAMAGKFIDDGRAWHEPPFTPEEDRDYRRRTAGEKVAFLRPSRAQRQAAEGQTTDPKTNSISFQREPPPRPSARDRDIIINMVMELAESFLPEGEWWTPETEHRVDHIERRLNLALGLPADAPFEVAPPGFVWTPPFVAPVATSEKTAEKPSGEGVTPIGACPKK
jgi:hypothetical protein